MQFELAPFDLPDGYGEGIVSLADVKAHLRVLHDDEDVLIGLLRDAAVDMVEKHCGVYLAERTGVEWRGERLVSPLALGVWPVTNISAITYLDSDGETVTAVHGDWRIVQRDRIALKPGKTMPSDVAAGVSITFDAGFASPPPALLQAVRFFAAHLYINRAAVITGTISGEIPLGFRELCSRYRMPVI